MSAKSQQQHVNTNLSLQKHPPRIRRERSNSGEKETPNIQPAPMFPYRTIAPLLKYVDINMGNGTGDEETNENSSRPLGTQS